MSGVAKVTVQTQIARGELFTSAQEVYEFLKKYLVKNITQNITLINFQLMSWKTRYKLM